jgi:hypothetical protein
LIISQILLILIIIPLMNLVFVSITSLVSTPTSSSMAGIVNVSTSTVRLANFAYVSNAS